MRIAALALAGALVAGCNYFDPMQVQPKQKPYSRSAFYADGLAMRAPPAGSVPASAVLDAAVASGRGPDGEPLLRSPLPVTRSLLDAGRKKFEILCAACHGLVGDGRSPVARNMSLRPPPSLHDFRERRDGWFYLVITEGFGLMPSYAAQLAPEERWAVVAYVRALQLSQNASLEQVPAAERRRLEREGAR